MPATMRSEFRKLSTVRAPWLLLAAGPLVVLAGVTGLVQSGGDVHDPATQGTALAHVGLAAVFTLMFGILAVAGEYRHGTITDTFLSFPGRRAVIAAKLAVYGLVGGLAGVVSSLVAVAATAAWWAAKGGSFQLSSAGTWRTLGGGRGRQHRVRADRRRGGRADPEPGRGGGRRAGLDRPGRGHRRAVARHRAGPLAAVATPASRWTGPR